MGAGNGLGSIQRKKKVVGLVAIALLLFFTFLSVLGFLSVVEWIIADLIVAVAANLILKNISKQRQ